MDPAHIRTLARSGSRARCAHRIGGAGIIAIYFGVILRWVQLATIVTLFTHFMLLRAPLTTDLGSWRATAGLTYTITLAGLGLLGAWLARHTTEPLLHHP